MLSLDSAKPPTFQPLTASQIPATALMLANAFEVDSAYRYLFPDADGRNAGLRDFFAGNLRTHLAHRCTHVAADASGNALATVTLRPPEGIHISLPTMLRRGLLTFARAHGGGAVRRLLWLKSTYDAIEAEIAGGQPHWYVHMMAVDPSHQGHGLGSELLDRVLSITARTTPELATVLTTHRERNLAFYARAGFRLLWERRLNPPGGNPYSVWAMKRD